MSKPKDNTIDFPEAFLKRMAGLLGKDYPRFFASLYQPAISGLRVNTLKLSPEAFVNRSPYHLTPITWCSAGFIIHDDQDYEISAGKHPYHLAGLYYLQEPSAMTAAEILAPQPGEKILDLCAAPGGKATHLAALMNGSGILIANEIHPKRVWDLAENLERCGVNNAIITNETPKRLADHFGEYFDRVLVDAPCSGEGMFRKAAIARQEWKAELVSHCAKRQSAILDQAARLVVPGGFLAYTTCTFSPEENEGVINHFLNKYKEFALVSIRKSAGFQPARPDWINLPSSDRVSQAIRIWPHLSSAEGHFIASFVKHDSLEKDKHLGFATHAVSKIKILKEDRENYIEFNEFCHANLSISLDDRVLLKKGSYLYRLPNEPPEITGIKVIHPGWWLGAIKKDRFTPSHSFAMGLKDENVRFVRSFNHDDPKLIGYLSGNSFADKGENGWILIMVEGFPIGWGKRVKNVLKNFYPRGLRRVA